MKKFFKILSVIILVIIISMLVIPFAFKGKITSLVKVQGNEMIKGEFDFSSLDISLFKHFPKATISLNDFWLHGQGVFEKDTLARVDELSVTLDLKSLMGDKYDVDNIYLDNATLKAVVAKDSTVNWDIMKADSSTVDNDTTVTAFNIHLKKVVVENLAVCYDDRQAGTIQNYDGINMDLSFQIQDNKYQLTNSTIQAMDMKALLNGWVSMVEGQDIDFDIDLKTSKASLSLPDMPIINVQPSHIHATPQILTLDQTTINVANSDMTLDCTINNLMNYLSDKGELSGKMNISSSFIDVNDFMNDTKDVQKSDVKDGSSEDVASDSSMEVPANINFVIGAKIKKLKMDQTLVNNMTGQVVVKDQVVTMNKILFDIISSSQDMNVNIKGGLNGWLTVIKGQEMNFDMDLKASKISLTVPDMPIIEVKPSHVHVTPKLLTLYPTTFNIANSDMTLDGTVNNFMDYFSDKGVLKGKMNFSSNLIDLNDFISDTDSTQTSSAQTNTVASESAIEVPANINFVIGAKIKKLTMDALLVQNMKGQLLIKNQTLEMNNILFDLMNGSGKMTGSYNTQNIKEPKADMKLGMKNISFAQAYEQAEVIKKFAPIFSHAKGTFSTDMTLGMILDNQMSPVMNTVQGEGYILTDNLLVTDVKVLKTLADVSGKSELSKIETKNIDIDFVVKDGFVTTSPFDVKVGNYKMTMSGKTGLDQSIDYDANVDLPKGEEIAGMSKVNFKIEGTFSKPKVKLDTKKIFKQIINTDSIMKDPVKATKDILKKGKSLLKNLHF